MREGAMRDAALMLGEVIAAACGISAPVSKLERPAQPPENRQWRNRHGRPDHFGYMPRTPIGAPQTLVRKVTGQRQPAGNCAERERVLPSRETNHSDAKARDDQIVKRRRRPPDV